MKFCTHCGSEVADEAVVCVKCGCMLLTGKKFCRNCGNTINENAVICVQCGVSVSDKITTQKTKTLPPESISEKDWLTTLLLIIFTGGVGGHDYYLGKTNVGIAKSITFGASIILSFVVIGILGFIGLLIWSLVELIALCSGELKDAEGKIILNKS